VSTSREKEEEKKKLTHSLIHGAKPFLRSCQLCSYSRTSQHFMEPEGTLPCSQEPSTGPYSDPDQSNPYHRSYLSKIHFDIVLVFLVVFSFWHSHQCPICREKETHTNYKNKSIFITQTVAAVPLTQIKVINEKREK
jgi:hypothetical protein